MPRLHFALFGALVLATATGCQPTTGPLTPSAVVAPKPIDDAAFARELHDLLRDGKRSEARQAKLLGVVRTQLGHAMHRFALGADARATASGVAAFTLLRSGEESSSLLDTETEPVFARLAQHFAGRGEDGRAAFFYTALAEHGSAPAKAAAQDHLQALDRFLLETASTRPIVRLGDKQRSLLGLAVFDPRGVGPFLLHNGALVDGAIEENVRFRQTGRRPPPEDATEVARALSTGGLLPALVHLRYGDLAAGIAAIESTSSRRVLDPELFALLTQTESAGDAGAYRSLYAGLAGYFEGRTGGELGYDELLVRSALFAIALEAYRKDPTHMPTAVELARTLTDMGLSEAVPGVLADAAAHVRSPGDLAVAMHTLLLAVQADGLIGDTDAARRTAMAAEPLLELAAKSEEPRLARVVSETRMRLAAVLARAGDGAGAIAEAQRAGRIELAENELLLADLQRQAGRSGLALEALDRADKASDATDLSRLRAALLRLELHHAAADAPKAEQAMAVALSLAEALRASSSRSAERIEALAILARLRLAGGDAAEARRVLLHAQTEADGKPDLLGAAMLRGVGIAFVAGDLPLAQASLRRAVDARAPAADLVYGALWVAALERDLGQPVGEAVSEVFSQAHPKERWIADLLGFANGQLKSSELAARAGNEAERVEAKFYAALSTRKADRVRSDEALAVVGSSPVVGLLEVGLARELLMPRMAYSMPSRAGSRQSAASQPPTKSGAKKKKR